MTKELALNILIANAVCTDVDNGLHCHEHCPFYDKSKDNEDPFESCCLDGVEQYLCNDKIIAEAVKVLVNKSF